MTEANLAGKDTSDLPHSRHPTPPPPCGLLLMQMASPNEEATLGILSLQRALPTFTSCAKAMTTCSCAEAQNQDQLKVTLGRNIFSFSKKSFFGKWDFRFMHRNGNLGVSFCLFHCLLILLSPFAVLQRAEAEGRGMRHLLNRWSLERSHKRQPCSR